MLYIFYVNVGIVRFGTFFAYRSFREHQKGDFNIIVVYFTVIYGFQKSV